VEREIDIPFAPYACVEIARRCDGEQVDFLPKTRRKFPNPALSTSVSIRILGSDFARASDQCLFSLHQHENPTFLNFSSDPTWEWEILRRRSRKEFRENMCLLEVRVNRRLRRNNVYSWLFREKRRLKPSTASSHSALRVRIEFSPRGLELTLRLGILTATSTHVHVIVFPEDGKAKREKEEETSLLAKVFHRLGLFGNSRMLPSRKEVEESNHVNFAKTCGTHRVGRNFKCCEKTSPKRKLQECTWTFIHAPSHHGVHR
jgi:hypothetical protein